MKAAEASRDPEEDRLVERFAAVCEAAGERGLQACLEFMIFSSVKTIADAERVLNRAGHDPSPAARYRAWSGDLPTSGISASSVSLPVLRPADRRLARCPAGAAGATHIPPSGRNRSRSAPAWRSGQRDQEPRASDYVPH